MTFHVGQKVVCVVGLSCPDFSGPLVEGDVYTVREIQSGAVGWPLGVAGVCVVEIQGGFSEEYGLEFSFLASRFRPAVERKTSIEIFTRMLTPNKQGVDA